MNQLQVKGSKGSRLKLKDRTFFKKRLLISGIFLVICSGTAFYYFWLAPNLPAITYEYEAGGAANAEETQLKVQELIYSDSQDDAKRAEKVVSLEQKAAKESGDIAYIARAATWKAEVLINEGKYQEALDLVLSHESEASELPDEARDALYAAIAWAYRHQGNTQKVNEYLNKIKGESFSG